jgi:predicted ATPase
MEMELKFQTNGWVHVYRASLSHAAGDGLVFAEETVETTRDDGSESSPRIDLRSGHLETRIPREIAKGTPGDRAADYLRSWPRAYHFQDTSATARVRQYGYIGDCISLLPDAGNLAAVLYRLREVDEPAYRRIVGVIRLIAPYFDDFDLAPEGRDIILNWRERGWDQLLGSHQLSDGTLRAMCLATLLLLPENQQPDMIVVDEPELGLHPYALKIVADLFQKVAKHKQVLVSTQSSAFVDEFDPEDVIVVDRGAEGSTFTRLDPETLAAWLDEYTLGEIWEKNVVGGGPH